MQKFLTMSYMYVIFVAMQFTSMRAESLEYSLARLSEALKDLESFLSSSPSTSIGSKKTSLLGVGKQALGHTNQFRSQQKLPPLQWNQTLADLAREHSENMALGKVAFGHAGFSQRVSRFPFRYRSAAENVFYQTSKNNLAEIAVRAWSKSPGHRKNLLGKFNYCGIGAAKSVDNKWYLTQIFALSR